MQRCHGLGEVFNIFDTPDNERRALKRLFRQIHNMLTPRGVFDIAEPGETIRETAVKGFFEREAWVVLIERKEELEGETLTRRITSFRQVGEHYRRADEVHRLRLYKSADMVGELRRVGFRVPTMRHYGLYPLPRADAALAARKSA